MAKYTDRFKDLDSNAIDELINEAKEYKKEIAKQEEEKRIEELRSNLRIGASAFTKHKNQIVEGVITGLTETSATLRTKSGERVNRRYSKLGLKREDVS